MAINLLILAALLIGWFIGWWPTRNLISHLRETNEKWAYINTEIFNLHHNTILQMQKSQQPFFNPTEATPEEVQKEFADMTGGRM